jgi:hypothetical protein
VFWQHLLGASPIFSLQMIRQTLSRIADQEKADGLGADRPGIEEERHLIGWIDPACGVQPKVAQLLARHGDITLTMNISTRTGAWNRR